MRVNIVTLNTVLMNSMKLIKNTLIAASVLFSAITLASNDLVVTKPVLTSAGAKLIANAALAKAKSENWNVVIAVNDQSGKLAYFERMDGAMLSSIDVAIEKANTAVLYNRDTKVFHDRVEGGELPLMTLPDMLSFTGALPIKVDGVLIGSIGVSGVKGHQDAEIAQAGIDAFLKALEK